MPSRRSVLRVLGGGVILAATGAVGFVTTRTPTAALRPWADAAAETEPRRRALAHALLAPNPHNRQPWLVDLGVPQQVTVWRDLARRLPMTDPLDRQLTIGMGCFLELMVVAASVTGHGVALDLFPDGMADGAPVAVARFTPGAAPDPLADHILARRSCKEPYAATPVPATAVAALSPHARIVTEAAAVADLIALTWDAWQIEATTPRALRESVDLMRIGRAEIEANPDGIDLGGPFLEGLSLVGALSRSGQADPGSAEFAQTVALYREMLHATPAYAVVETPGTSRLDQIAAGRAWMRLNLAATGLGLALHPVSQALQEYPEMDGARARAQAMLASPGAHVQMLGRLGYGPATPPSPRWPLDSRLRT